VLASIRTNLAEFCEALTDAVHVVDENDPDELYIITDAIVVNLVATFKELLAKVTALAGKPRYFSIAR
jgi:hypothetical protein